MHHGACYEVPEVSQWSTRIHKSLSAPLGNGKGTTVCFAFQRKVCKTSPHGFTAAELNVPLRKATLNQSVRHNLWVRLLKIITWSPP